MKSIWQLQEAKNKFSELVEQALRNGAQIVTRHGRRVVVVLPYTDYAKMTRPEGNLADFLMRSPMAGLELDIDRDRSLPRDVEIS